MNRRASPSCLCRLAYRVHFAKPNPATGDRRRAGRQECEGSRAPVGSRWHFRRRRLLVGGHVRRPDRFRRRRMEIRDAAFPLDMVRTLSGWLGSHSIRRQEASPRYPEDEPFMPFATIPEAIEEIRAGRMLVVVDDEDRENEGAESWPLEDSAGVGASHQKLSTMSWRPTPLWRETARRIELSVPTLRARCAGTAIR